MDLVLLVLQCCSRLAAAVGLALAMLLSLSAPRLLLPADIAACDIVAAAAVEAVVVAVDPAVVVAAVAPIWPWKTVHPPPQRRVLSAYPYQHHLHLTLHQLVFFHFGIIELTERQRRTS